MAPMHVKHAREVPEYEINPKEFDFTNSVNLTKVPLLLFLLLWLSYFSCDSWFNSS